MLAEAAEMTASRQASKKKPRTYADYREMLKEKDLDIVLIATPDHWHALPMIAAVEAGRRRLRPEADQRRRGRGPGHARRRPQARPGRPGRHPAPEHAAPHRGPRPDHQGRQARQDRPRRSLLLLSHAQPSTTRPTPRRRSTSTTRCGPARPRCGPTTRSSTRAAGGRSWSTATASWATCAFTCSTWSAGCSSLGWPKRVASTGGILVDKGAKANIADTQTATFDFGDLDVVWQHRTWGSEPDPKYPWGATIYGDKGTLKRQRPQLRLHPRRAAARRSTAMSTYELEQYPEDKTEKDLERHVAPAIRGHMRDFLAAIGSRGKPVADIEEGHISTASCILANLAIQLGRTLTWDAEKGQVVGDDEANRLLRRPYRAPWVHPATGGVRIDPGLLRQ